MTKEKYTLDRIEADQYVFLEHPEEINQLVIPFSEVPVEITEGTIVLIERLDGVYQIELLSEETEITRQKVESLLEKLKNKNN